MANWVLLRSAGREEEYSARFHVHPMLIRLLANREISSAEEIADILSGDIRAGSEYEGLPDLEKALGLLVGLKESGARIRIIGDYDVDGVLATVILMKGLAAYGLQADYAIPHRVIDGYGMNVRLIDEAYQDGIGAVITCDNGISALEEIGHAKELGMTVIVTDHHEVPKEGDQEILPPADAVIDPKRKDSTYPMEQICGAQVAYKLISALLVLNREDLPENLEELKKELLMFSAMASYEDVMPLKGENHRVIKWAISYMKESGNKGLQALIEAKGLAGRELKSYHIGFLLGPCINASGRLDSAERAVKLFLSDSLQYAKEEAEEIVRLNEERKSLSSQAEEMACALAQQAGEYDKVLVLYLPGVHESIAGIVAGRVRERFDRPTFILTDSQDGLKGSGRSVEAYDMYEALAAHKELFQKFGGHKMAAGLTLKEGCLEEFRRVLNEDCTLTEQDFEKKLRIDAVLPFSEVGLDLVRQLDLLEPYGTGFSQPLFAVRNARVVSLRPFGSSQEYLNMAVREGNRTFTLKAFRNAEGIRECLQAKYGEGVLEELGSRDDVLLHIAYQPVVNEYKGNVSVEFHIVDCK